MTIGLAIGTMYTTPLLGRLATGLCTRLVDAYGFEAARFEVRLYQLAIAIVLKPGADGGPDAAELGGIDSDHAREPRRI